MGPKAGATIDDDTGETNIKRDIRRVVPQRLRTVQFIGFSASSGESHVTCGKCFFLASLRVLIAQLTPSDVDLQGSGPLQSL